jgi:outer membrane biosynthesis protein TonB
MTRLESLATNRYALSYTAALLLHLLFLLLYAPLVEVMLIPFEGPSDVPESQPLAFEFVEVPDQRPAETPPAMTPLVSDRHSVASDMQDAALPESYLPYSEGLVESRDVRRTAPEREAWRDGDEQGKAEEASKERSGEDRAAGLESPSGRDYASLVEEQREQTRQEREEAVYGRPAVPPRSLQMDNRQSTALERGDLQLSTYAWDFAPYLAYLKRHIQNHIFPPPAFTQLGLIEGKTTARFVILRDGTMRALECLEYEGSSLLRDTSLRALSLSAPFRPLPDDFPDEYLEITGIFNYVILPPGWR